MLRSRWSYSASRPTSALSSSSAPRVRDTVGVADAVADDLAERPSASPPKSAISIVCVSRFERFSY